MYPPNARFLKRPFQRRLSQLLELQCQSLMEEMERTRECIGDIVFDRLCYVVFAVIHFQEIQEHLEEIQILSSDIGDSKHRADSDN